LEFCNWDFGFWFGFISSNLSNSIPENFFVWNKKIKFWERRGLVDGCCLNHSNILLTTKSMLKIFTQISYSFIQNVGYFSLNSVLNKYIIYNIDLWWCIFESCYSTPVSTYCEIDRIRSCGIVGVYLPKENYYNNLNIITIAGSWFYSSYLFKRIQAVYEKTEWIDFLVYILCYIWPPILAGPVWIPCRYGRILVSGALLLQGKSSLELLTAITVLLLRIIVSHYIKWPPLISIFLGHTKLITYTYTFSELFNFVLEKL